MISENLKYSIEIIDDIQIIHVLSSISSITRKKFYQIMDAVSQKHNVIVNMSKVPSVTSSGLHVLADITMRARGYGKRVLLMGMKPEVIRIIEQLDMYDQFIFVDTIEEGQVKIRHYT